MTQSRPVSRRSKTLAAGSILGISSLLLAACGSAPEESSAGDGENKDYKGCIVSDSGGFDDRSFNQNSHEGLMKAKEDYGISTAEAESKAQTDFETNINQMVQQDCNIIIGVGFLLEDAIQEAAEANPDTNFALIDSGFTDENFDPVEIDNAKPILFNTAEASFLAGYLSAGMSESGTVATFGGIKLPSVAIFMDGFADGVDKYNEDNSTEVKLLGWDKDAQEGSFSGDFENQSQARP